MIMWMTDVKHMCRLHLLGEHYSIHLFLRSDEKLKGYLNNNELEPLSMKIRHDELIEEMSKRKMSHLSPITDKELKKWLKKHKFIKCDVKIDVEESTETLYKKCKFCKDFLNDNKKKL